MLKNAQTPCPQESFSTVSETYLRTFLAAHPDMLKAGNLYEIILSELEKPLIKLILEETNFNQSKAAAILGINRNTLRKKMTALKIKP